MMLFQKDTWLEIFHALDKNKLRTILTMVGVSWGMLLFVFLLGLVNGMRNGFNRDLKGTSTNSLFIWTQQTSIPYAGYGRGRSFEIDQSDIDALKKRFNEIEIITPRNRNNALVIHGAQSKNYKIYADYPEQNEMFVKKIIQGRFINQNDLNTKAKNLLIGDGVVEDLYKPNEAVIGSIIKINNIAFTVVGLYEGEQNFEGRNSIIMPFTTFSQLFNLGDKVGFVAINIKDEADIKKMENDFKAFLKTRHKISPEDTQAFGSFNLGELFGKIFNFMRGLEFLTIIVGFLTLLAGVIAVSSILLITVKERTKEFGIRRALGAKPRQIIYQILLESAIITIISGLIGIITATIILFSINQFAENQNNSEIPLINSSVNISILLGAFSLILVMAILAGFIPAMRAISIKPIDALREE